MERKQLFCNRPGCGKPRYAKGLCGWCHLEEYPPAPRAPWERKPSPAKPARQGLKAHGKPSKASLSEVPEEVVQLALARCEGLCEACGEPVWGYVHKHHRLRRRDGLHFASNIVILHPDCHVIAPQAVHQRPVWAKERGLIVPFWASPAEEVLTLATGRRVLLDDEGRYLSPRDGVIHAA